ncbi:hypothetical protein BGZ76_005213 [Entomortierella beljakovae]|nr:hypothetical protein BGZ76_005213 [Entomortierella beljakovae]
MTNNQIEFDIPTMTDVLEKLDNFRRQSSQDQLPLDLLEILEQTSFLHSAKDDIDSKMKPTQQSYHFIHLTFQEYFAATWLSKYFQTNTTNPTTTSMLMNKDETISLIQKNKYNPRYEIVWLMIAGLLEGEALESYFQLLQSAPRDLNGVRHQLLIAGCYKEAYSRLSLNSITQIESELSQWLRFEITTPSYDDGEGSIIGRQSVFPEEILIRIIGESKVNPKQIFRALAYRRSLSSSTIRQLLQMVSTGDTDIVQLSLATLGKQVSLSESAALALVNTLQDEDEDIRNAAANALSYQSTWSESTTTVLGDTQQNETSSVRNTTAYAFDKNSTLSEIMTTALVKALRDNSSSVREAAAITLGKNSMLSEKINSALVDALQDKVKDVRFQAAKALSNQHTLSENTVTALGTALQDENRSIRIVAASSLGKQSSLSRATLDLIFASNDGEIIRKSLTSVLMTSEIYLSMKDWTKNKIEMFYKHAFFSFSRDHYVSLFIHGDRLQIYTEQGFDQSDKLSDDILHKIESAFATVQKSSGIELYYMKQPNEE